MNQKNLNSQPSLPSKKIKEKQIHIDHLPPMPFPLTTCTLQTIDVVPVYVASGPLLFVHSHIICNLCVFIFLFSGWGKHFTNYCIDHSFSFKFQLSGHHLNQLYLADFTNFELGSKLPMHEDDGIHIIIYIRKINCTGLSKYMN